MTVKPWRIDYERLIRVSRLTHINQIKTRIAVEQIHKKHQIVRLIESA